jgi:hypothetical protein
MGGRLSPHLSGVWPGRKKQVQANSLRFSKSLPLFEFQTDISANVPYAD